MFLNPFQSAPFNQGELIFPSENDSTEIEPCSSALMRRELGRQDRNINRGRREIKMSLKRSQATEVHGFWQGKCCAINSLLQRKLLKV